MLMDSPLELLGITDSNIKITRFSAESVNGEKRNVIEARLTYNVDRCSYCESERVVRNGSKILHTRLTELHQERFEMKLYKQRYLCKECLKTWSARTDIVEEGHTLSHQLKRSVLHMARERLIDVLENYRRSGQNIDTAISTLKKNMTAVLNSVEYDFSNGPVEGINRRIKSLKRSCFGFRNLDNFRKRIALIRS